MFGKKFFVNRYEEFGWRFEETKPRQAIRINMINGKEADTVKRLQSLGIKLEKVPFLKSGYWVNKARFSIGATTEYLLGLYSIQEAAAQIPATLFTKLKNKTVLDACAAPGGKTIQLADLMRNTGAIIALDIKRQRLAALMNHLERCHVSNVIVYHLDARLASQLNMKFDGILLDVPCSGNFATDKVWFKRRTLEDIEKNAGIQREMLAEATKILKDDGEIVYSTCSLEPEEDELNIDWATETLNLEIEKIDCRGEKGLVRVFERKLDNAIENCRRIWPSETQGFFVCKLKKRVNR